MDGVIESCFFFQAEDGIRYLTVTGVQTCALPISQAGSPPVSLPARAPRYPAARRRRRVRPPRAPPPFSSRRARPAAALDSAGAPRPTAPCVHAAEERCPRACAVARPASTAPGPGQGQRLPGTSPAAARPTGATPVRLARARLVEPPAPAQYRQRSVAFDLGHARSPVVRLGAGGGGHEGNSSNSQVTARERWGGAQGRATTKLRGPRRGPTTCCCS